MRWIKRGLAAVAGLIVLALAVVYGGSEWVIRKSYAVPLPQIAADRTPAGVAEGTRLAAAFGCSNCHGAQGQGKVIADIPFVVHIAPPALAPIAAAYSDAELARLIRHGVKRNGTGTYVMPVEGHNAIADEDLARIIGWIRTLKPSAADSKDALSFGPMGRFAILMGGVQPEVRTGTRAEPKRMADMGAYIADAVCAGCHSMRDKRTAHDDGRPVPSLVEAVPPYDIAPFKKLLSTGKGLTQRDLGLMGMVGREDLSHLTPAEVEALHAYILREAQK